MSCSYYTFRQNDYYCMKKQDYVNSDVYYKYCRNYDYGDCPIYKGDTSSGGCYLTSACVEAKGLPDDCMELTVLRSFRDNWLKQQPGGLAEVAEYYATAPGIVEKVNTLPNAGEVWNELYEKLVLPCMRYIQNGEMELAHELYRKISCSLSEKCHMG